MVGGKALLTMRINFHNVLTKFDNNWTEDEKYEVYEMRWMGEYITELKKKLKYNHSQLLVILNYYHNHFSIF